MANFHFQTLPGFRDFTPRECAFRNYLFSIWREVARRYGFTEYDTPILEDTGLYLKKSGGELSSQLFRFEDQGGRDVCLRPEVTASLARVVGQHQREYPKPLKWFEIGQCFRYETPQKGRGREFYQFNVDIIGEEGPQADAELIALAIDTMLALGFAEGDFLVRVSDRQAWLDFASSHKIAEKDIPEFLQIIDKKERQEPEITIAKLAKFGLSPDEIDDFIADPENASPAFHEIYSNLKARGLDRYLTLDLTIVRGLDYYTGVVFEVFDTRKSLRAVAGGGRYNTLISTITDGQVDLPATGFAMGDLVIQHFIQETPQALLRLESYLQKNSASCDVYLVLADSEKRAEALALMAALRNAGISVDMGFGSQNVGKQFKAATRIQARFALVIGQEYPELTLKALSSRSEEKAHALGLAEWMKDRLQEPDGPLLA